MAAISDGFTLEICETFKILRFHKIHRISRIYEN